MSRRHGFIDQTLIMTVLYTGYTEAAKGDGSMPESGVVLVNEVVMRCTAPIYHFGFPNLSHTSCLLTYWVIHGHRVLRMFDFTTKHMDFFLHRQRHTRHPFQRLQWSAQKFIYHLSSGNSSISRPTCLTA